MMPSVATEFDAEAVAGEVSSRLREKYPDLDPTHVEAVVREEVERLSHSTVTDYVSVLSMKSAKKRLKHGT
ncbi:MAG: hypothetical protein QOE37_1194 [Microbacteriaceae bacterium]|nr:hypothetical protein [Microbacteriaceae bacterium]